LQWDVAVRRFAVRNSSILQSTTAPLETAFWQTGVWVSLPESLRQAIQAISTQTGISILGKIATDLIAGSLANSGIGNPKSPIQNPELIFPGAFSADQKFF
jgi:hypothetical protein